LQGFDLLGYELTELAVGILFAFGVADAPPRGEVRTAADVDFVHIIPTNEPQLSISRLQLLASRMTSRTCFS
jgi:hypothetical protein